MSLSLSCSVQRLFKIGLENIRKMRALGNILYKLYHGVNNWYGGFIYTLDDRKSQGEQLLFTITSTDMLLQLFISME